MATQKEMRESRDMKREGSGRSKRIPVGTRRLKLATDARVPENKVGRWVADTPGRIQAFLEGGYTFVEDVEATVGEGAENTREGTTTKVSKVMGTSREGGGKRGYLMVIDKELYEEDQAAKQAEVDRLEENIKRGKPDAGQFGNDGQYITEDGVSIEHKHFRK